MPISQTIPGGDKLHHLLAYAGLMLVWRLAMPQANTRTQLKLAILLMLMGVAIEFAQGLTPHRFFEWADALANATGVCLGWSVAALLIRVRPSNWFRQQS
ncbi:MAG: VanZ family protein [Burkholderiales bacterium]|jgi:VanZ family protein